MTTTEAKLLLSASILMLRDSPELEVLLVKRHHEVDFASGAYVFPGGKIAPGDQAGDWENQTDGDFTGEELALRIGAIREAFEESGLLLARHANSRGVGAPLVGSDIALALAPMRAPVDRGEVDFLGLLKE
ncbi:MAG: NUDIX domain-containing protein, partial [Pikeienuella sp.]